MPNLAEMDNPGHHLVLYDQHSILKPAQKLTYLVSAVGLSVVSGFGGLLGFYIPGYVEQGKGYADITHLMTFPTLFM